jgi:Tfp pilus assembly protein PilX
MKRRPHQGLALPTLMALLALASIATLLAMRNLWVNEQLLNAEADQLRTQHKAEAALSIARQDITGTASLRHLASSDSPTQAFFPSTLSDYTLLRQRLGADLCRSGICAPPLLDVTANQASYWQTQTNTAMPVDASDTPDGSNSAWYWVDVFPQTNSTAFVYRITVLAHGVMPASSTVLQTLWTRSTPTATTGQWLSWRVLHD